MNNKLNLELSEIRKEKFLNNNTRINNYPNKLDAEETKANIYPKNYLFNKINLVNKSNNLLIKSRNNNILKPIIQSRFSNNNESIINKIKYRIKQKSTNETVKDKLDNRIHNINMLSRNSSFLNNMKSKKIFNFKNCAIRNKSTSFIFDGMNQIFPLIKPRKILINIYSGPYEYKINDISKSNNNYKKFGKNSIYMGERYNPENYAIKEKIKVGRNYYGALYSC